MDPAFGHRSLLDELRFLLAGDQLFLHDGGDGGGDGGGSGGGDGGGSGDGDDRSGSDDDESQADNDDRSGSGDDQQETLSQEAARKLRSENRNQRERAKKAEAELETLKRKDLDEKERAEADLKTSTEKVSTLEGQVRSLTLRVAAAEAGIPPGRAKAAAALVDDGELDLEDEKAVIDALKGLKKDHGYLFAAENDGSGDGGKGKRPGDIDAGKRDRKSGSGSDDVFGPSRLRKAHAEAST